MADNKTVEINNQKAQVNKSLVKVAILSSIMLFAGFSSAVLVRKMDKFWVNIQLPEDFIISTFLIVFSSITLYLSLWFAKRDQIKKMKTSLIATIILGLGFCFFQIKGWYNYYSHGNALKSYVMNTSGMYGENYIIYKNGSPIVNDGEHYFVGGNQLKDKEVNELKDLAYKICGNDKSMSPKPYEIEIYKKPYYIVSSKDSIELEFIKGIPYKNGIKLSMSERDDLFKFAFGVYNNFPFFMIDGKYGVDFLISMNGKELIYDKKKFYEPEIKIKDLPEKLKNKIKLPAKSDYAIDMPVTFETENGPDTRMLSLDENNQWVFLKKELNSVQYNELFQTLNISSPFVYVLTVFHFLHFLMGWVVLMVVFFRANKQKYNSRYQGGLKAGSIFWHFVGILWVYLYVFLEYIN